MAAGLAVHFPDAEAVMRRALELARRGIGFVEPNPPVGAVLVDDRLQLLGEGIHERFGGPHAEVNALREAGDLAAGSTLFVTLEPCAHFGKTPPCADAVIAAGVRRVVAAAGDPAPHASGQGLQKLRAAGIDVETGLLGAEARSLIAPFVTLTTQGRPFVHAKWAMTLDGRIASRTGASRWISNEASRRVVHQLRGRMDGILIGIGTALQDDPLLTARPPGPRTPVRIVLDSQARLPEDSQLVSTAHQFPLLVVTADGCRPDVMERVNRLAARGVSVLRLAPDPSGRIELSELMRELVRRHMTNLLVEGGGKIHGAFFDAGFVDEVHVFIAPKLVGGDEAVSPVKGIGQKTVPQLPSLVSTEVRLLEGDVYLHGRTIR